MQTKGKITGFRPTLDGAEIQITADTDDYESLERLQKSDVRVEIKTWREPRSRSSNNYFYVLVEKLANVLRVSKPYVHNLMLRKYGQLQRIGGKPIWVVLPESDEVAHKVDEDETLHVRPTDQVQEGKDGRIYRTYLLLKGSHEMDSKEMSILIQGLVDECKQMGIETMPKEELERMLNGAESRFN